VAEAQAETLSMETVGTGLPRDWQGDAARRLQTVAFVLSVGFVLLAAFILGMALRHWTWEVCRPMRWEWDRDNAFNWGMRVNLDERKSVSDSPVGTWGEFWAGYRTVYDTEWKSPSRDVIDPLDYTPLRLLTAGLWARSVVIARPTATSPMWSEVRPLLSMNIICTIAAAAGAFVLVRFWILRQGGRHWRAWVCGAIAAILMWLNPAGILDSHGWPQWDMWCMPFLVWATVCASTGAWFLAGVLIVMGAMLKGQILLIAPVFLIWALLSGWGAPAVRMLVGVFTAAGVLTWIWLVQTNEAWWWVATVLAGGALCRAGMLIWKRSRRVGIGLAVSSIIVLWPMLEKSLRSGGTFILLVMVWAIVALPLLQVRWPTLRRWRGIWAAGLLCIGIWGGACFFGGSMSWFRVGFIFPTNHNQVMSYAASSLPEILEAQWGWNLQDIMISTPFPKLGFDDGITLQWTMRLIYIGFVLICGIFAAIQSRRGSARLLLAVIAPSVLFYALLAQMQERYLVWGALFTACGVAVSMDMLMLHLVVTFVAFVDILRKLCWMDPNYAPAVYRTVGGVEAREMPELGWVVLMVALMYVYFACKMDRRNGRNGSQLPAALPAEAGGAGMNLPAGAATADIGHQ
jgi:hypothetical protein